MSSVLGSIFGFGDKLKRRLKDAVSNPSNYSEMTADENRNEWRKNPDERSMGFFNPVPLGNVSPFMLRKQMKEAIAEIPKVENSIYSKMPGQTLTDTKYVQRNIRDQAELDHIISSGYLLPKEGGKAKKYFTAVDEVNPDVPTGNTMIRIAREKVSPNEAVSAKDVERFNFSLNSWEPLIKEPSVNMSRRDFMKKSAGLAGGTAAASIPGAKLLQKFAPEEKEIAAKAIPKEWASVEGGAHRYHSLKDYLDDVSTRAEGDILMSGNKWDDSLWQKDMRERLLQDELAYKEAKRNLSSASPKKDSTTGLPPKSQTELIDSFSPQAKKEMKEFKSLTKQIDTDYTGTHDWTKWATNNMEDPSRIVAELKRWYIP